jgi:hypothetical protein
MSTIGGTDYDRQPTAGDKLNNSRFATGGSKGSSVFSGLASRQIIGGSNTYGGEIGGGAPLGRH